MFNIDIERLRRVPQHPVEVWQGGVSRLPSWITGKGAIPYRARVALWVSVDRPNLHAGQARQPDRSPIAMAVEALVEFACDAAHGGYRPGKVQVRDGALAEHLNGLLADTGIDVERVDDLPALDARFADMVRPFSGRVPHPIPLEGPGVTLDRMRAFAEAGAAFYRAAPWQYLTDMDLIEIEKPDAPQTCRLTTVLGAGGVTFGLGFYATIKDYARARKIDRPGAGGAPLPNDMWHLTFGPITELSTYDPDLWEDHDLPVAGAQAYPYVLGLMTSRQVVRANAGELAFVEGLLRALARTTEHQIDSGRWESRVDTFDGPMTFTLALPEAARAADAQGTD